MNIKNKKVRSTRFYAGLVFIVALAAFFVASSFPPQHSEIIHAQIKAGSSWADFDVAVPEKFIGPDTLALARSVKDGTRVKMVPIAVLYPSLEPWPDDWQEKTDSLNLMLILIFQSQPIAIRRSVATIEKFRRAVGTEHDMQKFKGANDFTYYYKALRPEEDVKIRCTFKASVCQYTILADRIWIEFSYPKAKLADWKAVTQNIRNFVGQFPVKGTQYEPEGWKELPDIIPYHVWEESREIDEPFKFNVPLEYIAKSQFKDGINLPITFYHLKLDVQYPSMKPTEDVEIIVPEKEFSMTILVSPRGELESFLHTHDRKAGILEDGKIIDYYTPYTHHLRESGSIYGLDYHFTWRPNGEGDTSLRDKKYVYISDVMQEYTLIECEKKIKTNLCDMQYRFHPQMEIRILFPKEKLHLWKEIKQKSTEIIEEFMKNK